MHDCHPRSQNSSNFDKFEPETFHFHRMWDWVGRFLARNRCRPKRGATASPGCWVCRKREPTFGRTKHHACSKQEYIHKKHTTQNCA